MSNPTVETYFLVTVNADGSIGTLGELPAELPERGRVANNWDVYQTAKQITEEFEKSVLAERVAAQVVAALKPSIPSVSDTVKDALKERGINPEA